MSFTHTNAPARTSAAQISVPTPLPPPVTSARRPERSISTLTASDLHDHGDHRGAAPGLIEDEAPERLARVATQGVEVGGTLACRFRDRLAHDLLGRFDQ